MGLVCEASPIVKLALDEWLMARAKPIYVFPRLGGIERKVIRGGTDYGPILLVEGKDLIWLSTALEPIRMQYVAPSG